VNLINEKRLAGKILALGSLATLLIVTPWWTVDPINVPKFSALVISAGLLLGLMVKNYKVITSPQNRVLLSFSLLFMLFLSTAFFFSEINKVTQLIGVTGRNTGLLTYVSLLLIFIAAASYTTKGFERTLIHTLMVGGSLSVIYGLMQSLKLDPADWVNSYNPVIGFLGNPNFQTSFIGMVGISVSALLLGGKLKLSFRLLGVVYILVTLFVISRGDSQQGFLVFIAGATVIGGMYVFQFKLKKFSWVYLTLALFGFITVALGTLRQGPLSSLLYKDSVTYRGDYWRAGWKITTENPFFGVGLDGYGDWYRRARTIEATVRRGPDVTSNAAHNVLLDLSSNGGFPLLFAYLMLISLVVLSIGKVVRNQVKFDPYFAALVGAWVAYQAQSIISLNQIGLAVWGWVLGGAIIGYSKFLSDPVFGDGKKKPFGRSASDIARSKISPAATVAVFLGLVAGVIAGISPFMASAEYRQALESGDVSTIVNAAYIKPIEVSRMIQIAATLKDNNLVDQALPIIQDATTRFPDSFEAWGVLTSMSNATPEQVERAFIEMKRLDPLNPNLK
jgi:O-antigen ligase